MIQGDGRNRNLRCGCCTVDFCTPTAYLLAASFAWTYNSYWEQLLAACGKRINMYSPSPMSRLHDLITHHHLSSSEQFPDLLSYAFVLKPHKQKHSIPLTLDALGDCISQTRSFAPSPPGELEQIPESRSTVASK